MKNKQAVSLKDVAECCHVSTVTVSRVLNNAPSVREYNRKKVLDAMQKLNYTPNAAARSLAFGSTGVIGMIVPKLNDPFFNQIIVECNRELMQENLVLAITVADENSLKFICGQRRFDGIMLLAGSQEKKFLPTLQQSRLPFVLLDNQTVSAQYTSVLVDNFDGGYQVGTHFLSLGHRKIGFIGGPQELVNSAKRKDGLCAALAQANVSLYCEARGTFSFSSGYEIMHQWIVQNTIPTAVFAADCNIAFGAIHALQECRLRVPSDVSVCGFDDEPMAREYIPSLTTVIQPALKIAQCATQEITRMIRGEMVTPKTMQMKPSLVVRGSTASVLAQCL